MIKINNKDNVSIPIDKNKKSIKITYLAGAINYKDKYQFECSKRWRKWFTSKLSDIGIDVFNPLERIGGDSICKEERMLLRIASDNGDIFTVRNIFSNIIDTDLDLVIRSDFITMYLGRRDDYEICGTYGEISLAKFLDKDVYVISEREFNEIPDWVTGCSTEIFKSFDDYLNFLRIKYG